MAFRPLMTKRAALTLTGVSTAIISGNLLTIPKLHLESATPIGWESIEQKPAKPEPIRYRRKPIYDEPNPYQASTPESAQPTLPASTPSEIRTPSEPTATRLSTTENLAAHIRLARLFLHAHVAVAEDAVNAGLNRAFELENNFTSTIANLAPRPESGEKLLPGGIYVLVAAMGGSIITRNRGLLLRATGPLALGVTAGWVLIPVTMRNIGDLIWRWEERVPAVRDNHLLVRGFLVQGAKEARERGELVSEWVEGVARQGREGLEGLIRKGR